MANPVIKSIAENTWVLVAEDVYTATVEIFSGSGVTFFRNYRVAGGTAPTDLSDAHIMSPSYQFESSALSDVYVYAKGGAGTVRVSA